MEDYEIDIVLDFLQHLQLDLNDFPNPGGKFYVCPIVKANLIYADLINGVYFDIQPVGRTSWFQYESATKLGDLGHFTFALPFDLNDEEQ